MPKCLQCKKEVDIIRSAIKGEIYIKDSCDACIASKGERADGARKYFREWDKREHAKSLVQPWEKEFPSAYGYEKAKEAGWSDEQIRRNT